MSSGGCACGQPGQRAAVCALPVGRARVCRGGGRRGGRRVGRRHVGRRRTQRERRRAACTAAREARPQAKARSARDAVDARAAERLEQHLAMPQQPRRLARTGVARLCRRGRGRRQRRGGRAVGRAPQPVAEELQAELERLAGDAATHRDSLRPAARHRAAQRALACQEAGTTTAVAQPAGRVAQPARVAGSSATTTAAQPVVRIAAGSRPWCCCRAHRTCPRRGSQIGSPRDSSSKSADTKFSHLIILCPPLLE